MTRMDRQFVTAAVLRARWRRSGLRVLIVAFFVFWGSTPLAGAMPTVIIGTDNNSEDNGFVQPPAPPEAGFGLTQSLEFSDVLIGESPDETSGQEHVLIGRLGSDVLLAGLGDDVLIGGPEHFNPLSSDRLMGDRGRDLMIWSPGDGSELFDGGLGTDAVIVGLVGELVGNSETPVFEIQRDRRGGNVFLQPETNLPRVDVGNTPGFCRVVDAASQPEAGAELDALGLTHLVQFIVRAEAENGIEDGNNGLLSTLHLKDVEWLICASEAGGEIVVLDLTVSPPQPATLDDIEPRAFRFRLLEIVF
ncbi:hypothetical protein [Candidatus Entotheonella palauensis]|uniref:hypothetical protein n=1 Tax=Candidatus Entotheonella palauensis TaxID=93172 RepID=UPI000B7CA77A|nr:hypothetical protein [Candidatus Entotheonella palauensis]